MPDSIHRSVIVIAENICHLTAVVLACTGDWPAGTYFAALAILANVHLMRNYPGTKP